MGLGVQLPKLLCPFVNGNFLAPATPVIHAWND